MLKDLLNLWKSEESFTKMITAIRKDDHYRSSVTGLDGSARAFFIAALADAARRPILVVAADLRRAEKIYTDLEVFLPGQVNILPARELFVNSEVLTASSEYQQERLRFLEWLYAKSSGIYVAPAAALLSRALPPDLWRRMVIDLKTGLKVDQQILLEQLVDRGYERVSLAETAGQFSARGDIIDIFPPGRQEPVRLELFTDHIDSIRFYDPANQRSTKQVQDISILPARELLLTGDLYEQGSSSIVRCLEKSVSNLLRWGEEDQAEHLKQQVARHLDRLTQPDGLDLLSSYFSFFYDQGAALTDYITSDHLVFLDEPALLAEKAAILRQEYEDYQAHAIAEGDLPGSGYELLWREEVIISRLPCPVVDCSQFTETDLFYRAAESYSIESRNTPLYHGQWAMFFSDLSNWQKQNYRVYLLSPSAQRSSGLLDLLAEQGCSGQRVAATGASNSLSALTALVAGLEEGFIIPTLQLAVVTEQNMLPGRHKKKRITTGRGIRLRDYRELSSGDYVVHEQHGVGRYNGITTLDIGGIKRDYLFLKYRGSDKLYIPVEQVGLIQKYSGGEGPAPRLHSLGGGEWQRIKNRVNSSVEELARELLMLYAARQAVEGYSFGPDHPWQQEFEAQFPFEETADQMQAIADVKADLQKKHPMDRLICGDVGYGKTEVAMRAAFKVVTEGKQVAVLVPTTVLAQQHYRTFQERFSSFPVRIAQLSRFVSPSKQKELISELAAGKIDLVIGTHRLLSQDIRFSDLGLLVIDEEQRFGVRQKEKIKKLRFEVDTLSMTATPIPRTLHLSLSGARDFSIIDTPPENRYPIQTYVIEYSEQLVHEAIQRELNRQGQVFLVYNHVNRIDAFAEKIARLFPAVSIAVGHGQLPESILERVMADFQEGRYQVLVSTTIIESGLDIPNVNTLIVYEADRFGLAQLYQIRGRVGRSDRLAYAYLTYRKDKMISETARKRLKAIKEFTELGSGFKIALRDLEIRGAGNILGAEQHGFIAAVGYDLYVKLLDQAVALLKNEKPEQAVNPRLEIQVSAYLPSSYIAAQDQKIDLYQRIYHAASIDELAEIETEMTDRYGTASEPVNSLLQVARLRVTAAELGIEMIKQQKDLLVLHFIPSASIDQILLSKISPPAGERLTVSSVQPLIVKVKGVGRLMPLLDNIKAVLQVLTGLSLTASGSSKQV